MKKKLVISFFIIIYAFTLQAQPPRRDTTLIGFNAGMQQANNAPILRSNSNGTIITPVRQQFCFDLTIDIDLFFGGHTSRQTTLFFNTTDGYMGYTRPSVGGPITELMPEIEDFSFTVVSFKLGNAFMYQNRKASRGEGIDHLVSTSNSTSHEFQITNTIVNQLFTKKGQVHSYCEGKATGVSYKIDGQQTEWIVNGPQYPQTFKIEKYLGLFGVGIIRTNAGVFIIMELKSGTTNVTIKRVERRNVCFNPSEYKLMEDDFYAKQTASFQAESEKIDRDEAHIQEEHSPCAGPKMDEINFRREMLRKAQDNLTKAQQGNLMQDRVAQKAMIDMVDPVAMVQQSILSVKTNICGTEDYISKHPENSASAQDKLACLNQYLGTLGQLVTQMRAMDARYTNPAQANAEKSRLMMTAMRTGCN